MLIALRAISLAGCKNKIPEGIREAQGDIEQARRVARLYRSATAEENTNRHTCCRDPCTTRDAPEWRESSTRDHWPIRFGRDNLEYSNGSILMDFSGAAAGDNPDETQKTDEAFREKTYTDYNNKDSIQMLEKDSFEDESKPQEGY